MEEEYDDDKIGGGDDDPDVKDQVTQTQVLHAVDAFIEDKKAWFKDLHKEFGDEKERHVMFKVPQNLGVPREEEIANGEDLEQIDKETHEKMRTFAETFEDADEVYLEKIKKIENGELPLDESDSDKEEKWDCDTILSTYTNTDNHPGIIRTERRVRTN